jgi:formate-dependent nitrite reductase membrane component NrfD
MTPELIESVSTRTNPHIDPSLHIWGWEIVVYLFLGGLVAGLFILIAALQLKTGEKLRSAAYRHMPLAALILLSLGMGALFLDLEHKLFVWRFYLAFKLGSPMSWGSWILMIVYPAGLLLWAVSMIESERAWILREVPGKTAGPTQKLFEFADGKRRQILVTSIATGVGLGIYTGLLLGTMASRIQWNSAVLGPLFLASGLSTGAAFMLLFRSDPEEAQTVVRWDMWAIGAELFLIVLMLVGFASSGEAGHFAAENLLGGPWTAVFWSLVVVMGLLVPLTLELIETRRHLPLALLTPVLILAGGLALRAILLLAGQESNFRLLP